jgi:two-component system sensor histidine kinase RegB
MHHGGAVDTLAEMWSTPRASDGPRSRRPRLAILLSGPLASPLESKDRWLVQLRWLALAGMTATVITARLLAPSLAVAPLAIVLAAIATLNVGWTLLLRRSVKEWVAVQLAVDAILLAALLWFSGGLDNPFAVFIVFQIALAGVLADGRSTVRIGALAVASIGVLSWAAPLPLADAPLGRGRILAFGKLTSLVSLCLFLGFFALVYARRLKELRDASARNERLAMLGRLVGGMSHELATPLGTILLGSRDLASLVRDDHPDAAELAAAIATEAERASDIIGLLRGHIRPDQRAERVDLSALVSEIAARELDRLNFPGERVIDTPGPVPAAVLRVGLAQVLRNLLANAAHATSEARPPAERRIVVAVYADGDRLEVSVTDNGPGISPAIAERLGEPFQTTKEGSGGLGLGLYVSSVLARQMRASLRVEDAEGGGAKVVLALPRDPSQVKEMSA